MTFEEFFSKKKIDLVQLEKTDLGLFTAFKSHYEQMGEKSFDHSKKFWFNKLRHSYPLKEEPKAEETARIQTPSVPQPESSLAPALKPTPDTSSTQPAPAYKPRFSPGNISSKPQQAAENEVQPREEKKEETPAQPATYKPRFNVKNIPAKTETASSQTPAITPSTTEEPEKKETKPAYKPRFNIKNIKPKSEE